MWSALRVGYDFRNVSQLWMYSDPNMKSSQTHVTYPP